MRKHAQLIMGASPMAFGPGPAMVMNMANGGHPARGAAAMLDELASEFSDFHNRAAARIANVESSLDEINASLAALKVGGAGDPDPDAGRTIFAQSPSSAAMVEFMRTGSSGAFAALNPRGGMSSDSDPDGGWTVPTQIDSVIQNQMIELSPLRRVASIVNVSTAQYQRLINRRGATSGWVGEREARGETENPVLGLIAPPMGEIFAQPEITQRLLDDSSFNLVSFLSENVSDEFALQEGAAFARGNGIGKPRGYLTLPVATTDVAAMAALDEATVDLYRLEKANPMERPRVQYGRLLVGRNEDGDVFEPLYAVSLQQIEHERKRHAHTIRAMWGNHPSLSNTETRLNARYDVLTEEFSRKEADWLAAREVCGMKAAFEREERAVDVADEAKDAVFSHDFTTLEEFLLAIRHTEKMASINGDENDVLVELGILARCLVRNRPAA